MASTASSGDVAHQAVEHHRAVGLGHRPDELGDLRGVEPGNLGQDPRRHVGRQRRQVVEHRRRDVAHVRADTAGSVALSQPKHDRRYTIVDERREHRIDTANPRRRRR